MGLETGSYINSLVASNPTGIDPKGQGDDHIRLIKAVLKNTFPSLTGAVTVSQTQINDTAKPGVLCFPGMITLWAGSTASIPEGWKICNGVGTISTGVAVPDLRDRFVVGAGSAYSVGSTGGSSTHSHTLSISVAGHALTINEMPSHSHTIDGGNAGSFGSLVDMDGGGVAGTVITNPQGGGQPHTHGASGTATNTSTLPPYYALAYIIKD